MAESFAQVLLQPWLFKSTDASIYADDVRDSDEEDFSHSSSDEDSSDKDSVKGSESGSSTTTSGDHEEVPSNRSSNANRLRIAINNTVFDADLDDISVPDQLVLYKKLQKILGPQITTCEFVSSLHSRQEDQIQYVINRGYSELRQRGVHLDSEFSNLSSPRLADDLQKICKVLDSRNSVPQINSGSLSGSLLRYFLQMSSAEALKRGHMSNTLSKFPPHLSRRLVEAICQDLKEKGEPLPRNMTYSTPSLLSLPRELQDQIYELCFANVTGDGYCLKFFDPRASHTGLMTASNRAVKRRKLADRGDTQERELKLPGIDIRFAGPKHLPKLVLVCRKLWNDIVTKSFIDNAVKIKIDCSSIDPADLIFDFWGQLFPSWLLREVHDVSMEFRCTVEQWEQMQGPLQSILRRTSMKRRPGTAGCKAQVSVVVRLYLVFPKQKHMDFVASLPTSWDQASKTRLGASWFDGHTQDFERTLVELQAIQCVQQLQILNLCTEAGWDTCWALDISFPTVLSREDDGWTKLRKAKLSWYTEEFQRHIKIEDGLIQDL